MSDQTPLIWSLTTCRDVQTVNDAPRQQKTAVGFVRDERLIASHFAA